MDAIWQLLSDPGFLQAALGAVLIAALIYGILITAHQGDDEDRWDAIFDQHGDGLDAGDPELIEGTRQNRELLERHH